MESDVNNRMQMFRNIDDDYENEKKTKSTRSISLGNKKIELGHDAKPLKVDYTKTVTIIQPNPKQNKPIHRVTFTNNEMMSNDNDTDSRNDTISVASNDPNLDERQLSQQQQQQSDKYNISNVLKHIYALKYVQRNDENKTGASRQFWMPDDQVKECFECNDKFTTFRRRHHCRVCGQIFCGKCSDYEIPSQLIWPNSTGNIRACTFCWKFVAQMETGDLKHNTKSIKELMKRLSLSATAYSPFSQNNSESTDQLTKSSQLDSMLAAQVSYQSSSNLANMSNQSLSTPNQSFSNSPTLNTSSSSASLKPINSSVNLQQNLPVDDNNPFDITENKDYFKSQDVEMKQLIINNSLELRNLWVQVYHTSDGLQFQTRNVNKFKKINNCITGNELVEWLIKTKSVTRDQAIVIGQALCHGKWLECAYYNNQNINNNSINNHHLFYDDNSFYRPGSTALNCNRNDNIFEKKQVAQETEEGPEWIRELNKLITTADDEPISNNMFTLSEPETESKESNEDSDEIKVLPMIKIEPTAKVVDDAPFLSNLTIITGGSVSQMSTSPHALIAKPVSPKPTKTLNIINDSLLDLHKQLQIDLCRQLLKLKNLSMDWFDIIMPIVWKCVDLVKPDVKHDNDLMDIRNYIKIKKLINEDKKETRIVNGLVFTKNVAHKEMKKNLLNPKILLLRSSIEYQRTDEKMCSLEPIFTAESQYLKNSCSKLLLRHNPEILIVEKSVARIAQEIFLQSNVTLVLNVKSKIMEKLCRFLQAEPMYSIDDLVRKPKLGICSKFYVENFKMQSNRVKTLMFYEGTPTNLGCTVLLCGASLNELRAIKSLTNFLIYAAYNSKLEHSFILDKYADFEVKKSLHDSLNEPEHFAEKLTHSKSIEVDNNNKTQQANSNNTNNKKANDSESKTNIIKKEISIDQSPLDEVNNKKQADDDYTCDNDLIASNSQIRTRKDSQLKLTICNKHSEKSSFNLSRNFKELLDDLILSCSPFVQLRPPFLINENTTDPLVKYLPESYMNYLKSNILLRDSVAASNRLNNITLAEPTSTSTNEVNNENQIHDFLLMHLTKSFDNEEFKKLYADYKSRGGIAATLNTPKRLYLSETFTNGFDLSDPNETTSRSRSTIKESHKQTSVYDCLDIFNRQHLALLFYSQCETSPVYPNICNKPRVINMKFYSENDMTLGSFLAKNCFRPGYKCNNELCNTLIVMHTRTFLLIMVIGTNHQEDNQTNKASLRNAILIPPPIDAFSINRLIFIR